MWGAKPVNIPPVFPFQLRGQFDFLYVQFFYFLYGQI